MKKSEINILIVEDDRQLATAITEAIHREGFKSVHSLKPEEAISLAKIKPFHAVVVDVMLPKMNGVALAQALRAAGMNNETIIFMSGIYKDKGFAADAIQKVKAAAFLFKPFNIGDLLDVLNKHLASLVDPPKVALQSLLSTPYSSSRDRRKAIEQIDEISGLDLPFILSVFLEDAFSGHINLVNDSEEMFSIYLAKSEISGINTVDSTVGLSLSLVKNGFLSRADLVEVQQKKYRGDFLKSLIENGYLSPHAATLALKDYIKSEVDRLIGDETFRISISPTRKEKGSEASISLDDFTAIYVPLLNQRYTEGWFTKFYNDWLDHNFRRGPQYGDREHILKVIGQPDLFKVAEKLNEEPTLREILELSNGPRLPIFKLIHTLCSRRVFVFDLEKKSDRRDELQARLEKLLKEIDQKNPEQIFAALGLSSPLRAGEVARVYKEFAKNNHPDKLAAGAPAELRDLAQKVFSLVSDAHQTLTDEKRRETYYKGIEQKKLEEQIHAEKNLEEIPKLLAAGKKQEAVVLAKSVHAALNSDDSRIIYATALIKNSESMESVAEADSLISEVTFESRRKESYCIISGQIAVAKGQLQNAATLFKKAIEFNPHSLDARRGLMHIQNKLSGGKGVDFSKMSASDILKADLGEITKSFIKKHFG